MAAKLRFKVRQEVGDALVLARRAQSEAARPGGGYAKPEKLAVLFHTSSLRLRIALSFLRGLGWVVKQVMALAESQGCSGQQLAEAFFVVSLVDLHLCLQRDAFHFQARARLARAVAQVLSLSSPPLALPWNSEELRAHYRAAQTAAAFWLPTKAPPLDNAPPFFKSLDAQEEFRYLHRLFEKKRPQVLAMWVVDNPVTLWDQVGTVSSCIELILTFFVLCRFWGAY
ncbi:hypothetical protein EON64_10900 [archaeon]|nr:MAG: hypothetical protein EON64_10900 [archaeon]